MAPTFFQVASKVLEEHRWRPLWLQGGKITDVVWIGQDVLGWCTNLRPVFYDVVENKIRLPKLDSHIIVGGATCLSGHMRRKIFAFTERKSKPRIFVYSYPSMQFISECVKGTYHSYLATGFVGDYLISLSSIPDFKMTVWSWRTGVKITSVDTNITDAGPSSQSLQINYFFPTFLAQIGNKSGKLSTWEMTVCSGTVMFHESTVTLPRAALVKDACWSPDQSDVLAIVDHDGHIYLCDQVGRGLRRIVTSFRCGVCREIEPAALCWHRGGIVLRTTFCQIRFYRKDEQELWRRSCYEKSIKYPIALTSHPFKWDRLFYVSRQGYIVQIKLSDDGTHAEQEIKYCFGGQFQFVDFIRPWDEYLLCIETTSGIDITVYQVERGGVIVNRKIEMTGKLSTVQSHSELPLTVIASNKGEVMFISFLQCYNPKILGRCVMQTGELDLLKFSSSGRYLVACQKSRGACYFFKTTSGEQIRAIFHVNLDLEVLDILLFDTKDSLKLYVLHGTTHGTIPIGNLLFYYDLSIEKQENRNVTCTITLENYYKTLHYTFEPNEFAASPYLTKHIRFFKFVDWKDLVCHNAVIGGHHSKQMRISTNKKWMTTASVGGMVTIRSMRGKHIGKPTRFMTHHRRCYGVARAIANNTGNVIVALGTDGSLFAKRHLDKRIGSDVLDKYSELREFGYLIPEDFENKLEEYEKSLDEETVKLLTEPIVTFATDENPDMTFLEYKKLKKIEEEQKQATAEKAKILSSFNQLKKSVVKLLNNNETCSDLEKLPIGSFALDKAAREKKRKIAKDDREEVRRELLSLCTERDRVSDWLKEKFWNTQKILAQSILSLFDDLEVTNYAIGMDGYQSSDLFQYAQFVRQVIKEVLHGDVIYPWKTYSEAEIIDEFAKQTSVKEIDEIKKLFDDDEEDEIVTDDYDKTLLEGLTTHEFIEPSGLFYSQYKLYSFGQIFRDNANIIEDCKGLRIYFNKLFDDMYSIKEREMSLASERINRIFFINSELKLMFNESLEKTFEHPKWEPREKPESLITVKDSEMTARVYISPSQRAILDKQAAEEERLRLAMLANDFRERALIAMMDGVLEVRWEDYIKWDVPKPDCLVSGKNPDDYSEEEAQAVKKYKQDVQNLQAEREKYRKILQNDYAKINNMMRESIEKFNTRLEQFHLKKMKVETAIQQLNLRYVRGLVHHFHRIDELVKDEAIRKQIKKNHTWVPRLTEEIKKLQEIEEQLHTEYDSLLAKEKVMEKRMKIDFSTLGKSAFTAISVQYKRRPRILLKNVTPLELQDLTKAISTFEKPFYLTADCLEYIKQLEGLEIRPQTLPPSIESTHWDTLKALRRMKINHELKQQAVAVRIEETAAYLARFEFKLSEARNAMERSREELRRRRFERQERELNVEIQLVMKMGQTELASLRGNVSKDSENAVLVPRSTVEFVNEAILADGTRKILSINRFIEFKRDIELEEWELECLKSSLKLKQIELYYVRVTNVTREIRAYLAMKLRGLKEEKTQQKMDRSFEANRRIQEKVLVECQTKLETVNDEILRMAKKNQTMDAKIIQMNVERCDMELNRDIDGEIKENCYRKKVFKMIAERSAIVRKLLENYDEISLLRDKLHKLSCNTGVLLLVDSPIEEDAI